MLVATIVNHLAQNGRIFIQTDIEFLANEMFGFFRSCENLREILIKENPFEVKTEREKAVEEKNMLIYRAMFEKMV